MTTNKELEDERLRKKILEIIVDYIYNQTKTETIEMVVDRIIDIITNKNIEKFKKMINIKLNYLKTYRGTFKRGNFRQMLEEFKQQIQELKEIKEK